MDAEVMKHPRRYVAVRAALREDQ